jgi:hypothetical protein
VVATLEDYALFLEKLDRKDEAVALRLCLLSSK